MFMEKVCKKSLAVLLVVVLVVTGAFSSLVYADDSQYSLQYNTVQDEYGYWVTSGGYYNPDWYDYNCYAFAIEREFYSSYSYEYGFITSFQYQPGDFSDGFLVGGRAINTVYDCINVYELADIVCQDLHEMGYTNIDTYSYIPQVTSSEHLICVRTTALDPEDIEDRDYHFMKYDVATDAWYHKPGRTAVLKYNGIPNNDDYWYPEYCGNQGEYYDYEGYVYDSEIVFIKYDRKTMDPWLNNAVTTVLGPVDSYPYQSGDLVYQININECGTYRITIQFPEVTLFNPNYNITGGLFGPDFERVSYFDSNSVSITFTVNETNDLGTYYLNFWIKSFGYVHTEMVDISVECLIHEHNYSYMYLDANLHIKTCSCGTSTEVHYVRRADIVGNFAFCLGCGRKLNLNISNPAIFMGIINQITINGSYILPNGIVVLVDEDVEAYLNGTLTFYNPNEIPESA